MWEVVFIFAYCLTRKKQRFFCCIGLAALLLGGVLLVGGHIGRTQAALTLAESNLRLKNADDNQTRVDFLNRLGWQVGSYAAEVAEVVIPLEFDEVYQNYNQIQQEQGFDLTQYAGRQVKRYSYEVFNHPSGDQYVRANLLVYREKLVAGDVCSLQLNGFMHGLAMPQ